MRKGITLIALVVTIIVLLLLAGITISLLFGQNGVITKVMNQEWQLNKQNPKIEYQNC